MYFLALALGNAGMGTRCLEGAGALAGLQAAPVLQGLRGSTDHRRLVGQIVSPCILSCWAGVTCGCVPVLLGVRASGAHER